MKVLVLGAGVVGTAAAYFLNQSGHDVTVLERNDGAGLETSFANGGIVSAFTARPWAHPEVHGMLLRWLGREDAPYLFRLRADLAQWMWAARFLRQCTRARFEKTQATSLRLSTYSYECLKEVRAKENIEYDARAEGVLHLYGTQEALDHSARIELAMDDPRFHPEVVDMARAVTLEPALVQSAGRFKGALYYAQDETGDAHMFTAQLAKRAAQNGVNFEYGTNVKRLISTGVRVSAVETSQGSHEADAVVMSLGSYSPLLLKQIGIKAPIYPLKGYSVTIPAEGYNGAPTLGIHDGTRRIVMSRIGDRVRSAGTAELTGYNTDATPGRVKATLDAAMALFPNCGDASKAQGWAGLRPMTPDCVPILGRSRYQNLFMDTGHGSTGWTYACGSGRIVADMVSGRAPAIDLSGLTMDRFT